MWNLLLASILNEVKKKSCLLLKKISWINTCSNWSNYYWVRLSLTREVEGSLIQAINKKYGIKNLIIKKVTRKSILGI